MLTLKDAARRNILLPKNTTISECSLRARPRSEHFTYTDPLNPENSPIG